jgi:ATP phosphoribosyltransferase regulatory subunit
VLTEATGVLRSSAARTALGKLAETSDRLSDLGHGRRVVFDLGETRGWEYYTGLRFTVLVDGPGEALGQGGRDDRLLARFGRDAPATGFALALGHLQWTLRSRNATLVTQARELRLGVGGKPADAVRQLAERLRRRDIVAATLPFDRAADCLAFARAWGYDAVLFVGRGRQKLLLAADGSEHAMDGADLKAIRRLTGRAKP